MRKSPRARDHYSETQNFKEPLNHFNKDIRRAALKLTQNRMAQPALYISPPSHKLAHQKALPRGARAKPHK